MLIKKIETSDKKTHQDILELERICFPDSAWNKAQILSQITNHPSFILVDEQVIKSYLFTLANSWETEVLRVGTKPEFRNQSYGLEILKYFIDKYKGLPCFLEVAQNNRIAIKMYESLGFQLVDKRKGYYHDGIDALIYCRKGLN